MARRQREVDSSDRTPIVCMSTALPVKFEDTTREALGFSPPRPERFIGIEERVVRKIGFAVINAGDIDSLKELIRENRI